MDDVTNAVTSHEELDEFRDVGEASGLHNTEDDRFFDRELSWIRFNGRVLQEAESIDLPLGERLLFLAIFSSNLDEFFRVRVAALRSLLLIKKKKRRKLLSLRPRRLLKRIGAEVLAQQERFGRIFRNEVLPALVERGVELIDETRLTESEAVEVDRYFEAEVRPHLDVVPLGRAHEMPFVEDHTVYLVVETAGGPGVDDVVELGLPQTQLSLVRIPSPPLDRFITLNRADGGTRVIFLDDVIRRGLPELFPRHEVRGAWSVKVSRDADLYLEQELGDDLREAIKKSLKRRSRGMPVRFLYDLNTPRALVERIRVALGLVEDDLVEGGRYHNLHDLAGFPLPDDPALHYEPMPPLAHPELESSTSMLGAIGEKDRLLHFPYQSYGYVIRFLRQAAVDSRVEEIWISLYRVASESAIAQALIEAADRGKKVTVFVEVQARFDEESNLAWSERMERAGVTTLFGRPGIKVHAKIALVRRREGQDLRGYAFLGTGNFNEKTARIYTDYALLTADARLADEVYRVFQVLAGEDVTPEFDHLLVAPFSLRSRFYELISAEVSASLSGEQAGIVAKMNALQDHPMIERLYGAAQVGVPVELIVRGICCARPGVAELSEGMVIRSIIDRFLEHARIFKFHAGGESKVYLGSADWMSRNLNRRVEVAFPIYDPDIREEIEQELDVQLADNVKARVIDADQTNTFVSLGDGEAVRAQYATYERLQRRLESSSDER